MHGEQPHAVDIEQSAVELVSTKAFSGFPVSVLLSTFNVYYFKKVRLHFSDFAITG